jgi:hypothetical protein
MTTRSTGYSIRRSLAHALGLGLCYGALRLLGVTMGGAFGGVAGIAGVGIVFWGCDALARECWLALEKKLATGTAQQD